MSKEDSTSEKGQEKEAVSVSRADYESLMKQVAELSQQVKNNAKGVVNVERTKEHICNVRTWEGKIVVNTTKSWNEKVQGEKDKVPFIGLYLRGENEPVKVRLLDFSQDCRYIEGCVIKEVLNKPVVEEKGTVEMSQTKYEEFKTIGTGLRVPLRVESEVKSYVVVLPTGEEITLPDEAIN